jgi:IS30 family transposase
VATKLRLEWSPEQISGWLKQEGDLIGGLHNSHISTLVERQSRFTMLVKVNGTTSPQVVAHESSSS